MGFASNGKEMRRRVFREKEGKKEEREGKEGEREEEKEESKAPAGNVLYTI